jgi:two-component system chemotaxis sensor kinase CheA
MASDALKATFITETEDLLVQMEDGLLALESDPDDKETLNGIFRAGHTVKGSAGILDLKEIVAFTHVLENVLDRLRKNDLHIDETLISLLLNGKDVIAAMLGDVAEDHAVVETEFYTSTLASLRGYADAQALKTGAVKAAPQARAALDTACVWRLDLTLRPDTFEHGQDPYMLLLELADLGEVLRVEAHVDALPPFESLHVFTCHLSWTVILHSTATAERLMDVFLFVKEESRIEIRRVLDCAHWK